MVDVQIEEKEKHHIEVTFVDEDIGMVEAIRESLLEDENVEFAAVVKEHPEIGHPKLILKVKKGNPEAMVAKAASKVAKTAAELKKKVGK